MANHTSPRPLVEGAILAAVTAVFALIGNVVPLVPIFLPVPIVLIGMRHGFRVSFLTVVVVGLILAFTLGPGAALLETITFGSAGLAIGLGVHRKWPVTRTLVLTAAVSAVATFLMLALTFSLMGINLISELARSYSDAASMTRWVMDRYPQLVTPQAQTQLEQLELVPELIRRIWWAVVIGGSAFSAVFQYAVVRWTLHRLRVELPPVPAFATWRIPAEAVWVVALVAALYSFGPPGLRSVAEGLTLVMMTFYSVAGLALVYAVLRHYRLGRGTAAVVAFLLASSLGQFVAIAGLVDSLLDFRLWMETRE